jgi:acetyl-CoA acetyltransferase
MSQQRAGAAMRSGFLARQIAPITLAGPKGTSRLFEHDEFPRPDITPEKLASLKPSFRKDGKGSVTAGNSSGVTDGAAALLVASRRAALELRTVTSSDRTQRDQAFPSGRPTGKQSPLGAATRAAVERGGSQLPATFIRLTRMEPKVLAP